MKPIRRSSRKRQAIYDALCRSREHPSAEQLYRELKNEIPDLSLGTVYRNLGVLMQDGLVVSIGNVKGEERYDACTEPHAHFVCLSCGKVMDADVPLPAADYTELENRTAWKISSHSLCFNGLCEDCMKKS